MSLVFGDDFIDKIDLSEYPYGLEQLFYGGDDNPVPVVSAKNLILPATSLAEGCYRMLFQYCSFLVEAPVLPADDLSDWCYSFMFANCASLTESPELLATTLTEGCYMNMFQGCSNLNYIKCLATDISALYCTDDWVDGVATEGTFIKDPNTTWPTGENGIPSGWQ